MMKAVLQKLNFTLSASLPSATGSGSPVFPRSKVPAVPFFGTGNRSREPILSAGAARAQITVVSPQNPTVKLPGFLVGRSRGVLPLFFWWPISPSKWSKFPAPRKGVSTHLRIWKTKTTCNGTHLCFDRKCSARNRLAELHKAAVYNSLWASDTRQINKSKSQLVYFCSGSGA